MKLDLRKSSKTLRKHLAQRVRDYPLYINEGPGKDEAPISQITVVYEFDQSGWVAIVFDTRPQAKPDGEWNSYIEPNLIDFPDWIRAIEDLEENGAAIRVTLPDGTKASYDSDSSMEDLAQCFGQTIRDVLIGAQEDGLFASLPLASDCILIVEEQNGHYGWSDQDEAGPTSEQAYLTHLAGHVSSKAADARIAHWVNVLERIAAGKEADSEWSYLASDLAIERLQELGKTAVVPALKFVRKWASKPEFDADRPKRKINELPMQTPTTDVLMLVCESEYGTPEVEALLHDILRRSVAANRGRKLWGILPVWAARCLWQLFDAYPEPNQHDSTNELLNREKYTKARRTNR